jgi:hypothetical protein
VDLSSLESTVIVFRSDENFAFLFQGRIIGKSFLDDVIQFGDGDQEILAILGEQCEVEH